MREKLIELMNRIKREFNLTCPQFLGTVECCLACKYYHDDLCDYSARCADYLLQNGVVVLPCKVGDTVWYITNNKCKDVKIENIHQWVSGHWKFDGFYGVGQYREGYEFDLNDFGKTVFLTKEEAEKAFEKPTIMDK